MTLTLFPRFTEKGFTLVELMVAVVVLGILIAIAVPSFTKQIQRNQMRSTMADFITAVAYARSQAVTRAKPIFVRSTSATDDWASGWCVTESANCTGATPLRTFDGPKGLTTKGASSTVTSFEFDSQGHLKGSSTSLSLCSSDGTGKKITVLQLGQALAQDCTCTSNLCP